MRAAVGLGLDQCTIQLFFRYERPLDTRSWFIIATNSSSFVLVAVLLVEACLFCGIDGDVHVRGG